LLRKVIILEEIQSARIYTKHGHKLRFTNCLTIWY